MGRSGILVAQEDGRVEGGASPYNAMLHVLSQSSKPGSFRVCMQLLDALHASGLVADVQGYTSTIVACMKDGRPGLALELLAIMPSRGVEPDTACYNAAMRAATLSKSPDQALLLMDRLLMSSDGVAPDERSFAIAIDACKASRQVGHALALLAEAETRGFISSPVVTNAAAAACASAGQYAPLLALIKRMVSWEIGEWRSERVRSIDACPTISGC